MNSSSFYFNALDSVLNFGGVSLPPSLPSSLPPSLLPPFLLSFLPPSLPLFFLIIPVLQKVDCSTVKLENTEVHLAVVWIFWCSCRKSFVLPLTNVCNCFCSPWLPVTTVPHLSPLWEYFPCCLWKMLLQGTGEASGISVGARFVLQEWCYLGSYRRPHPQTVRIWGALPLKNLDHKRRIVMCWEGSHSRKSIWMNERYASKVGMVEINEPPKEE